MKQIRYIVCLFASCLLMAACSSHRAEKAWIEQGESLKDSLPDSALVVLQKVKLPESLGDRWLARWCMAYGDAADKAKEPMPEVSQLLRASGYLRRHSNAEQQARIALFLGRSYAKDKDYEKAIAVYAEGMTIALKGKVWNQAGYISGYSGDIHFLKGNFDEALKRYKKAAFYFNRAGNQRSYVFSLHDIGQTYFFDDSTDRALSYFKQIESYMPFLNKADQAYMYNGFGNVYGSMGEYDKAERCLLKANQLDSSEMAPNFLALSQLRLSQGDIHGAKTYVKKAEIPTQNTLTPVGLLKQKYVIAKAENRLSEALDYYEQYESSYDSVRDVLDNANVAEVEKRYEHQQILADAMRLQVTSQRYFSAMLLFLFLCLLIGFIHIIRVRKKERKIHEQQQQLLEDENHLLHLSEDLRQKEEELQKLREENSEQWGPLIADIRRLKAEKLQFTPIYRTLVKLIKMFTPDSQSLSDANWKDIHTTVDAAFESFYRNLHQTYPDVSEKEIDYCYLQFFNFKIKEESILLGITPDSVKKLRSRIRQHLGIVGEKQDLRELLLSLSTISPLAKS